MYPEAILFFHRKKETGVIVSKLTEGDLVLVASFSIDGYNVPYYNPESVRLISSSTNVPVFCYTDMGFGDGAFGGSILSYRKAGLLAGKAAVKIMNRADPQSIKFSENDY